MNKLLAILGPTATGKTDLVLDLAKKFNGELVACDSRQVYVGLDIGTGKLPSKNSKLKKQNRVWNINGVNIWMYDVVSPKVQYSVADYVRDASRIIEKIRERGKLPIIVGGTGLYLKALLEGLSNLEVSVDKKLRKSLEKLTLGELQKSLQKINHVKWKLMNNSDRQNPRRLIRAIEIDSSDKSLESRKTNPRLLTLETSDYLKIGLTAPREVLYKRVDDRVLKRIDQGMVEEAKQLYKNGLSLKRMRELGLEYRILADYSDGKIKTVDELIRILQGEIHGYTRRQLTWFKKEKDIEWIDITNKYWVKEVENRVLDWYNG